MRPLLLVRDRAAQRIYGGSGALREMTAGVSLRAAQRAAAGRRGEGT